MFLMLFLSVVLAEGRVWTDRGGRQFEAELVGGSGDELVMELAGGKRFSFSLKNLSAEDQTFIAGSVRAVSQAERGSNLRSPWPDEIRLRARSRVSVVEENRDSARYVYESDHYRFLCNVRLTRDVIENFAVLFETTYEFCQALPLELLRSGGGSRLEVILLETEEDYFRAGGSLGSVGCFFPATRRVMAPLSSLGVAKIAGGYRLDRERVNMVLVHELTHQLTPDAYYQPGVRGWFCEGLAEYVATTPYLWGYFDVDPHGNAAKAYVSAHGLKQNFGRVLGTEIAVPPVEAFMNQAYSSFSGGAANRNYGLGLLMVHHFFHFDGQGDARRIRAFLNALNRRQPMETAMAALLDGRTFKQVEQEIAAAWRAKGLTIRFPES